MNQSVIRLVEEVLCRGQAFRLNDSDSLLENGVADSLGIIELVKALESRYGIRVEDEELSPENLDSIAGLAAYLQRKGAAV